MLPCGKSCCCSSPGPRDLTRPGVAGPAEGQGF